jgi:type IX secretion system PorP/SprF family membrane protein
MRKFLRFILIGIAMLSIQELAAQGMHFSQYYNAPMLLSPANTGLMPDNDFRLGAQYRNQWAQVPASFNTISAYGDFQVLRNKNETNWLGIGGAFFNDRAGTGDLSLTKIQLTAAYHVQLGSYNMFSIGLGAAFVQRSVNFRKLTFDTQWDGFSFDPGLANGESYAFQRTSYADFSAGINYAFYPNENTYLKVGLGLDHVNAPTESFYKMENKIGRRPVANIDLLLRLDDNWIAEVSGYYTQQKSASEIVYGAQFSCNVSPHERRPNVLIFGVYHRLGDAVIPVLGFEWNKIKVLASSDITISSLSSATHGNGALEISFVYKGLYHPGTINPNAYNCPRF